MADIIDLISSSPPQSREKSTSQTSHFLPLRDEILEFDWNQFGSGRDLGFGIEQPAKKRRLSPRHYDVQESAQETHVRSAVFDLSSEDELLPRSPRNFGARRVDLHNDRVDFEGIDDVRISSSAPEPARRTMKEDEKEVLHDISSDPVVVIEEEIWAAKLSDGSAMPNISVQTANVLAKLGRNGKDDGTESGCQTRPSNFKSRRGPDKESTTASIQRFKKVTKSSAMQKDDIVDSSQTEVIKSKSKSAAKSTSEDHQSQTASKRASKEERDAAKEVEKERKRKEKEEKVREKQKAADLAEVNKSKTNKKNSTPEMIVDMPEALRRFSVGNQVEEYMKQLDVEVTYSQDEEVDLTSETAVTRGNIIQWRRRIIADYDDDLEIWKPLSQPRVTRENHILVYLKAEEFVNIAVVGQSSTTITSASDVSESAMKANLDEHVKCLRTRYPNCTIIYLIEGLASWNRKAQSAKNRAYTTAVRSQIVEDINEQNDESSTRTQSHLQPKPRSKQARGKRKQATQIDLSTITADTNETLLLHLQLHHQPLLIHHTTSVSTTSSQISNLTQHLSTRPYRLASQSHNLSSASFCMTTGQIRTGTTPHETYINMLQEINRVTPSMAYGISAAGYTNVGELTRGFVEEGNLMLEGVRKSVNKDGGWSDRRLGPMVSKRLAKVFLGRNPDVRDGIA